MFEGLKKIIASHDSFLVTTHDSPDGDAIGSALAFAELLRNLDKRVYTHCVDELPYFLKFLKGSDRFLRNINEIPTVEVVVVLDCAEYHRIGVDVRKVLKPSLMVNIDHHVSNSNFGDFNYVDRHASCVGEIILQIFDYFERKITRAIADDLFVSVMTDTGSFRYGCTTAASLSMAARLVEAGASPWKISTELYDSNPVERLQLLVDVLSTLSVDESGIFASIDISWESLKKHKGNYDMTDGFVNYPRSLKGVEIAILFRELEGKTKLSVRSIGSYNVSDFCSQYGGGGHKNAAGCFIPGKLMQVKRQVYEDLRKWLKKKQA